MSKVLIVETCDVDLWDDEEARRAHEKDIAKRLSQNKGYRVQSVSTTCKPTVLYFGGNDKTTVPKYRSVLLLQLTRENGGSPKKQKKK